MASAVHSPASSLGSLHSEGSLGSFGHSVHSQHSMQSRERVREALEQARARDALHFSSNRYSESSSAPCAGHSLQSPERLSAQDPAGPPVGGASQKAEQDLGGLQSGVVHSVAYSKFLHFTEKAREIEGKRSRESRRDEGHARRLPGEGSAGEPGADQHKEGGEGSEEVSARPAKRAKP